MGFAKPIEQIFIKLSRYIYVSKRYYTRRDTMRLCSIASGSSGNCIYVGSDNTHLLIDTGISKKMN